MNRVACTFLWVLLLAGIAGCGESVTLSPTVTSAPGILLRFAGPVGRATLYGTQFARFAEEQEDVAVQYVSLQTAQRAGELDFHRAASLGDVVLFDAPAPPDAAATFADLTPYLQDAGFGGESFWSGALDACAVGGVQVGVPIYLVPRVIFYDAGAFETAGVAPSETGWTWSEFATALARLEQPLVQRGGPTSLLGPLIGPLVPAGGGDVDAAALMAATDWYRDLAAAGHIHAPGAAAAEAAINRGEAAIWTGSPLEWTVYRGRLGDTVGMASFPVPDEQPDSASAPIIATCAGISTGTPTPDLAWAWLEYLVGNPLPARRLEVPALPAVAEASGYWNQLPDEYEAVYRFAVEQGWYGAPAPALAALDGALEASLAAEEGEELVVAVPTAAPLPTAAPITIQPTPVAAQDDAALHFFANSDLGARYRSVADAFTARSGIPIDMTVIPFWTWDMPFTIDLYAEYDCFLWSDDYHELAPGAAYTLTTSLQGDPLLADFGADILGRFKAGDDVLGLPVEIQPLLFYYHAERFQRRDVPPPTSDWTFAEMLDTAAQFPLGEGAARIFGYVPVPFGTYSHAADNPLLILLRSRGVNPFDLTAEPPLLQMDSPDAVDGVSWLAELAAAGVIPAYAGGGTRGASPQMLLDAVDRGSATIWSTFAGQNESLFVFGRTYPMGTVAPPRDLVAPPPLVTGFYVGQEGAQVDACLDWYRFLSTQPELFAGVPARLSLQDDAVWEAAAGTDQIAALRAALALPTAENPDQTFAQPVLAWWEDAVAAAFSGEAPGPLLAVAQEKAERYLACTGSETLTWEGYARCALEADPDYPMELPEEE